jgi:hypothetical protein
MKSADNLSPKELELANLVDFYNDVYTGTNYKHSLQKGLALKSIVVNMVVALNAESKDAAYKTR